MKKSKKEKIEKILLSKEDKIQLMNDIRVFMGSAINIYKTGFMAGMSGRKFLFDEGLKGKDVEDCIKEMGEDVK